METEDIEDIEDTEYTEYTENIEYTEYRGVRTGDSFYDRRVYLELYDRHLRRENYGKRAFGQHWINIFEYLAYYDKTGEPRDISEWCGEIDIFMMRYYLLQDRPMSMTQLRYMFSSLHGFYMCMRDNGVITFEEYDRVKVALYGNKDKWFRFRKEQEEQRGGEKELYRRPRKMIELGW